MYGLSFPNTIFSFSLVFFTGGDGLYTPTDLGELFNPPYDAGVRIHSNSWGCDAIVAVLILDLFLSPIILFFMLSCVSAVLPMILANLATIMKVRRKTSTGQALCSPDYCFCKGSYIGARFVAAKQDFLIVIAAGNNGARSSDKTVNPCDVSFLHVFFQFDYSLD